jgi:hypothetical protein
MVARARLLQPFSATLDGEEPWARVLVLRKLVALCFGARDKGAGASPSRTATAQPFFFARA